MTKDTRYPARIIDDSRAYDLKYLHRDTATILPAATVCAHRFEALRLTLAFDRAYDPTLDAVNASVQRPILCPMGPIQQSV